MRNPISLPSLKLYDRKGGRNGKYFPFEKNFGIFESLIENLLSLKYAIYYDISMLKNQNKIVTKTNIYHIYIIS